MSKEFGFFGVPVTDIRRAPGFCKNLLGLQATKVNEKKIGYGVGEGILMIHKRKAP